MSKTIKYNCLTLNQNGKDIVFFKVKAKDLLKFANVARKTDSNPNGYQRMFSEGRKKSIAKYINNGNILPNSILISFDKASLNKDKNEISFEYKPNIAWIIDGQHRVLGAREAENDIELPVIALLNADPAEQIHQFVTINREAKGVPSSLYIDLLGRLPRELSPKEVAQSRASDIANTLNGDEFSPFHKRIATISSPKPGQISKSNFVKKIEPLITKDKGRLSNYTIDEQIKIIDNYYKAIVTVFHNEYKKTKPIFFQTIGFGAFMKSFELIFNIILTNTNSFMIEKIVDLIKLVEVDLLGHFESWSQYGTGEKAEINAAEDVKELIRKVSSELNKGSSIRL